MNRLMSCAATASLIWSNAGLARNVDLESFAKPSGPSGRFVLQPTPTLHVDAQAAPSQGNSLAQAFDALADGDAKAPSAVDGGAVGLTIPAPAGQSNWRAQFYRYPEAPVCASEPYQPNPALPASAERRRATWYTAMVAAACEAGLPPLLLDALVIQESRYNPSALSPKGAAGISQLMPDRARQLGVRDVWNPVENLRGGARHLRTLLNEFGRFDLALAAYNAGEVRVRRKLMVPRIPETLGYVSGVLLTMRRELERRPIPSISFQR